MRTVRTCIGRQTSGAIDVSGASELEAPADNLDGLRRLVGRSVEADYKGLEVRCVFSDDTGQRGALGFVCDVYVGAERSHRTVYSYHESTTHVATTTVGPGAHRSAQSLPMTAFSVKFVVAREASWAKAFFKSSATAAAEHTTAITHQEDVNEILTKFLGAQRSREIPLGTIKVKISKQRHGDTIEVFVYANGEVQAFIRFLSRTWATTAKATMKQRATRFNTDVRIDVNIPDRSLRSVVSYLVKTALGTKAAEAASAPARQVETRIQNEHS